MTESILGLLLQNFMYKHLVKEDILIFISPRTYTEKDI